MRSEEHTSELQSRLHLVCRLLLEKKKKNTEHNTTTDDARRRCLTHHNSFLSLPHRPPLSSSLFFFNDTATTEIYTLSLHDALPISTSRDTARGQRGHANHRHFWSARLETTPPNSDSGPSVSDR